MYVSREKWAIAHHVAILPYCVADLWGAGLVQSVDNEELDAADAFNVVSILVI